MNNVVISGSKAGESEQHTPVEAPNDLRSVATARILLALGEGEFEGGVNEKSIYLDGTPLMSQNGTTNFPGVKWDFRSGTVDQQYIPGFPAVESETSIGVELKSDAPWTRSFNDGQISAVIIRFRWPALQEQKDNGDVVGYSIDYRVEVSTDGGPYVIASQQGVTGKTTSDYERSVRINLPSGNGWVVKVTRLTPNMNNNRIADLMYIGAVTEVIDRKMRYPNTALLGIQFDASQFSNTPTISVLAKMRKIRVPDNYDPVTRTYSGIWSGGFKIAYSNNPAWVTYDIIIENRFSVGDKVGPQFVDKYELYKIAQYCDQQVPDGKGGTEHRYECNIYIATAAEAWQVLRDIASIYRGMIYWMQSQMTVRADMPRDTDYIFTNANVIDGTFTYSGSDERVKYTRSLVSYDNPDNNFESDVTTTYDNALQRRYGDNVVELSAFGCTRESEAQRRGKWAIYTNNNDRTVAFKTGMEGEIPMIGHIVAVADNLISGVRIGGRISNVSADGKTITLDKEVTAAKSGDRLLLNLPSGKAETRTVETVTGREIKVSSVYSESPVKFLQWTLESDDITHQLFQIVSVKKADTDGIEYEFAGVSYNPSKFDFIDTGARIEDRPISQIPVGGMEAPEEVLISQSVHVEQTMAITTMTIGWPAVKNAVAYEVEWRKDYGEWVKMPRTGQLSVDIKGVYTGKYLARVRAINSAGVASVPKSSVLTDIVGKTGEPPALAIFTTTSKAFSIYLTWGFGPESEDALFTEIEYATNKQGTGASVLGSYAYPTTDHLMMGLSSGVEFWFRARIKDRTGNVGPWTNWTYGKSSTDANEILSYLEGKIGSGELAPGLIEEIESDVAAGIIDDVNQKIDTTNQTVADLELDVNQKINDTNQAVTDLEQGVNQRIDSVEVDFDGKLDGINQSLIGHLSGDDESASEDVLWYAGDDGLTGSFVGNVTTTSAYNSEDYAIAKETSILASRIGENQAYIASVESVAASRDEAIAQVVSELSVSVGENSALISSEQLARSTADESLSRSITALNAEVGDNSAKILNEQTARVNADGALSQEITALKAEVDDNAAAITSEASARASEDSALSTRIDTLTAEVGDNSAAILAEQTARADGDSALSQEITALTAEVGDNAAAILSEQTARADGDSALAASINALKAEVDDNSAAIVTESEVRAGAVSELDGKLTDDAIKSFGYLAGDDEQTEDLFQWYAGDDGQQESNVGNVSATSASNEQDYSLARQLTVIQVKSEENAAAITSEQLARVSANEALASDISSLSAEVSDNNALILSEQLARSTADESLARTIQALGSKVGDTEAKLTLEQTTRAAEDDALSQQILTLTAEVGDNSAAILAEQTARVNADGALSQEIAALTAEVGDNAAAILAEQAARANEDSALAQDIQTLSAQIGDAEAVIQQTSQAVANLDGSLKANWQVKTEVRQDGKVVQAGVGLGASIGEDGTSRSEFLVMADTIGFLNSINGEIHAPFVFDTVNDTAFLNAAIIGNASIGSAKFTDWLESDAKNQNNEPILRMNFRNGDIEINSSTSSGGMDISNDRIDIYDESGLLRVRLGRLI